MNNWIKKVQIGFCIGFLCLSMAQAQKIVNQKSAIAYTRLPAVSMPADIGTYKPFLALTGSQYKGMIDAEQVAYGLNLEGFEKVTENYDLEITLSLASFSIVEKEPKTIDRSYKDKKTGQTVTRYTYSYTVSVRLPAWIKARTYDGQAVWQKDISSTKKVYSESTKEFETSRDRDNYWRANQEIFLKGVQNDLINDFIASGNNHLSELAYRPLNYAISFTRVEPKKKSEHTYELFDQAWKLAKQAIAERDRTDISTGNAKFAEAIKLWRSEAERLDPDDKRARINQKVASTAYLNCALACIWINKFDLAEEYLSLASQLKGGGLRTNKIEKTYNFRKGQFTMYPNWTGARKITPRIGVASIYQDTPDGKLIAHNQRIMAAESMAYSQQQTAQNQTRGGSSNTALDGLTKLVVATDELITTLGGESNEANSNTQATQKTTLAPAQNTASALSYEAIKSPMSASLSATPVGEREKLLVAHAWQLNKIEFVNPLGRTQTQVIQDNCLLQESHQFQMDKQYFKTALGPCTPEGAPSRQWMSFDYESIIINESDGPRTLRIIDLNAYIMVLETVSHSNQKPLMRYTYIKTE